MPKSNLVAAPILLPALAACGFAFVSGCASKAHPRVESTTLAPFGTEPVALDIQNANGSIEVVIDSRLPAPIIQAKARGSIAEREARGLHGGAWFAHDLADEDGRKILRVLATDPTERGVGIDLKVKSPTCAGLRIRNAHGPITVRNAAGAIEINNGYAAGGTGANGGDVFITFGEAVTSPVTILTTGGHIDLSMPAESTGAVTATTLNGRVLTHTPQGAFKDAKYAESKWTGTLNGGTNMVQVHTASGNVDITLQRPTPTTWNSMYCPF